MKWGQPQEECARRFLFFQAATRPHAFSMAKLELFGSYVALVTPFTDADEVDYACIEQLVEWHVKEGTAVRKRRAA